jgi:hypothetical protein
MRLKVTRFAVLTCTVVALCAATAASASAASFQASSTGTLNGQLTNSTTFTGGSGQWKCTKAAVSGTATQLVSESVTVTYQYSNCGYFGFYTTSSPAEFVFHANGDVDLLNSFSFDVVAAGCKITVLPKNGVRSASYQNNAGKVSISNNLAAFNYTTTGGFCGSGGVLTINGKSEVGLQGGTLTYNS